MSAILSILGERPTRQTFLVVCFSRFVFVSQADLDYNYCTMAETAEAVAADVSSKRSATIEITNLTNNYCLINPK